MTIDWQLYWASRPQSLDGSIEEALAQVGKTRFGKPVPPEQITLLVEYIAETLRLSPDMAALDLGCGNGLITHALATRVEHVVGFDYSPALLETARKHFSASNVSYRTGDLTRMESQALHLSAIDVAWSIEVIQNLDPTTLPNLLSWLEKVLVPGGRFLASGIPDIDRIRSFYNTEERWRMHLENEREGREQMGHWWSKDDLSDAAETAGLQIEFVTLPEDFYTSTYRVDALLSKATV